MLKSAFPVRVVAFDADGIQRSVANLHDIAELAREKSERYNDSESKRFVADVDQLDETLQAHERLKEEVVSLRAKPTVKLKEGAAATVTAASPAEASTPKVVVGKASPDQKKALATVKTPATKKPAAKPAAKAAGKKR